MKAGIIMDNQYYIREAENVLLHTYNRAPVALERGEGVWVYDADGRKYLDFAAGIAVMGLGYAHPVFTEAIKKQVEKIVHTSNLYYSCSTADAAAALAAASQMDRVFFTNSGAEAIEGALKSARKYAYTKKSGKYEIIAMENSFHGRTMGSLSVTGTSHYREPFEPLVPGIRFAVYNDLDSVKALLNEKTCAIIAETVQGEGGIYPADPDFLTGLRRLCDETDTLLILDEIQCGMGRTGYMFAWQGYGVKPDIMCMAKAIGNGIPTGAFAMTQRVADDSLVPGDHGTTYGGNPLAGMAVRTVLEIFDKEHIVEHVREIAGYLEPRLDELCRSRSDILERRGKGLMQGLVLEQPVGDVVNRCRDNGLLVISAAGNVLRIVPPLIIEKEHADLFIDILTRCL